MAIIHEPDRKRRGLCQRLSAEGLPIQECRDTGFSAIEDPSRAQRGAGKAPCTQSPQISRFDDEIEITNAMLVRPMIDALIKKTGDG